MPKKTGGYKNRPDDVLPDISQLVTARLKPRPTQAETHVQQIAQHEAEIQRLVELAAVLEQAVTALVIRRHMASDPVKREALELSRADLERFKDELESLQTKHQNTIERIWSQIHTTRLPHTQ